MSEQYRLLYSGEVIEGQHAAVVKKRLQTMLKLDDERVNQLFSGNAVVVKKTTDKTTAARYQAAFKKAGAMLRVKALQVAGEPPEPVPGPQVQADSAPADLDLLPPGTDLLAPEERNEFTQAQIDTSHLSVQMSEQGATFNVDQTAASNQSPNTDHISLAEPGTSLRSEGAESEDLDPDAGMPTIEFDLAEVGAPLGDDHPPAPAAIDLDAVDFDVAEIGVELDTSEKSLPPQAPDTSHLNLDDNQQ